MIRSGSREAVRKITISLPEGLIAFTDNKVEARGMSRSGVIAEALSSLKEREMAEVDKAIKYNLGLS
jgi:metal-responsive CopG/Arc/MetJ family transcriptional regulator